MAKRTQPTAATSDSAGAHETAGNAGTDARWHDADELRWAVRHSAARMGVKVTRLQLRPMTRKWASISTTGRLTLNLELIDLPKHLGEFVVIHELVHLLAPNHGRVFKSFMHAYLPDWQQRERELRRVAAHSGKADLS